jgi:SAM-dependent methyltransferase
LPKVLNVGGGGRYLPAGYEGWEQTLLDVDPACEPDVLLDAKDLADCDPYYDTFDAALCSHCLEHFHPHDVPKVLNGMRLVVKPGGFVDVRVPDVRAMLEEMFRKGMDLDDVWYRVDGKPVTFHDVLYGWSVLIEKGKPAFAHHGAFSGKTLARALMTAGFENVTVATDGMNLYAKAVKPCP